MRIAFVRRSLLRHQQEGLAPLVQYEYLWKQIEGGCLSETAASRLINESGQAFNVDPMPLFLRNRRRARCIHSAKRYASAVLLANTTSSPGRNPHGVLTPWAAVFKRHALGASAVAYRESADE